MKGVDIGLLLGPLWTRLEKEEHKKSGHGWRLGSAWLRLGPVNSCVICCLARLGRE